MNALQRKVLRDALKACGMLMVSVAKDGQRTERLRRVAQAAGCDDVMVLELPDNPGRLFVLADAGDFCRLCGVPSSRKVQP